MEVAINMKTLFAVWWSFAWRSFLFFACSAMLVGLACDLVHDFAGVELEQFHSPLTVLGVFLMLGAGPCFALHRMTNKGFGRYRLQIKLRES